MNKLNDNFLETSIFHLLEKSAKSTPNLTAVQYKKSSNWEKMSWNELLNNVKLLSNALSASGMKYGDRVAILSNTRVEWILVDLAVLSLGGCTVPIYSSSVVGDIDFILKDSGAKIVFVEDYSQINKIRKTCLIDNYLTHVISFDIFKKDKLIEKEITYKDFLLQNITLKSNKKIDSIIYKSKSLATIVYTSGTTGKPKGVMLTHENLIYEARAIGNLGLLVKDDIQLLFLPMAHIFAKVLEVAWLQTGHELVFAENVGKVIDNMSKIRPTFMAAVPRIYEKIHAKIISNALKIGGIKGLLAKWAFKKFEDASEKELNGINENSIGWKLAQKLVFNKIANKLKNLFGGRLKFFISGGAPLSPQIACFFKYSGIKICEGYGLTETSAATTINLPDDVHIGTVGKAVPGTYMKINDDGEILIRGPGVFSGYWNNHAATSDSLRDGWFYTGDIGNIDELGFLKIIDRKKDLIVTAGGKNIAPQKIENLIKMKSELISQVVVQGDKRKFLSALITIDENLLLDWAKEIGISGTFIQLCKNQELQKKINQAISIANDSLPKYEQIKKFKILDHDLSTGKELTATLKVKRSLIYAKYKSIFDEFYN